MIRLWIIWIICATASYLLGSMPTGFLIARANGIDIRTIGSGNIGATNVFRALGNWWALFTLVVDAFKGFVAAYAFPVLASMFMGSERNTELGLVCAALAIAGHNWPLYLGFKGGKGVATSAGALFGIAPKIALMGVGTWLAVFALSRYVSLASMLAAIVICVAAWLIIYVEQGIVLPVVFTVLAALLIWRHRSNIRRLVRGQERRMRSSEFERR